ncbi:MAG: SurA N-terminal domain-containing protein [Pseudomonadales bacterium]
MQKLRDQTQGFGFKLLAGVIIFVLAIFGFGAFNLFLNSDPEIASVDGDEITQNDLALATDRERRRIAMQFGEAFDPDMIDSVRLQSMVLEQLITRTLLQNAADDLDIGVSQQRVDESITNNPAFQVDGQFQAEMYRRAVQAMRYSPQAFLKEMSDLLALEQLQNGLTRTAFRTGWELSQNARLLNQRRDLAFLSFTADEFSAQIDVSEADIELRYLENELDFQTPEAVDVDYVELTSESLINDESIAVSVDEVRSAYDADAAASLLGDRRRSRHILVQVGEERTGEQAMAVLVALKVRLEAGESFAELAQEFSEDPGSSADGGELGLVGKGVFDPEFERALWSLELGGLSEPVLTDFGYHLIRLDEIETAQYPSFETQQASIEVRLRRDQAAGLFSDRVRELDNLAFELPDSLQGIAAELSLEAKAAAGVSRDQGEGVFANVELRDAIFSNDVFEKGYNTAAVKLSDNRAVVARVTAHYPPQSEPLADVRDDIRTEIISERARVAAEESHEAALARIQAGESVTVVANDFRMRWQTFALSKRNHIDVPGSVLDAAFKLPRPAAGTKSVGESALDDGGHAVVTVTRVVDGDLAIMAESEIENMREFLDELAGNLDFSAFVATLEQAASISRPD